MPLVLSLYPDVDRLDLLIEQSMPWFALWCFALAAILIGIVVHEGIERLRRRSPVDRLIRRRHFG